MAERSRIFGRIAAAVVAALMLTNSASAADITLMCPPPMRSGRAA